MKTFCAEGRQLYPDAERNRAAARSTSFVGPTDGTSASRRGQQHFASVRRVVLLMSPAETTLRGGDAPVPEWTRTLAIALGRPVVDAAGATRLRVEVLVIELVAKPVAN